MEAKKETVLAGLQLLFWVSVLGIPVALVAQATSNTWMNLVMTLLSLVGAFILYKEIRSRKLLICVVAGVIGFALSVAVFFVPKSVELALSVIDAVANLVNLYCLFKGTADYMVEQSYPETAQDGRLAANLAVIVDVILAAIGVLGFITLTSDSISYVMITLGMVVMLASLAAAVMSIILLITRITFFNRCYKRLKSGKPERVPPLNDKTE